MSQPRHRSTAIAVLAAVMAVAAAGYAWRTIGRDQATPAPGQETNLSTSNVSVADSISHPMIGRPMPDLKLPALAGGEQSLAEYKGRTVILNFWTTW